MNRLARSCGCSASPRPDWKFRRGDNWLSSSIDRLYRLAAWRVAPREIQVTFVPRLKCQWRWLDQATLTCILGERDGLKPATEYRMVVNPSIAAADGSTLAKPVPHSFFTVRPRVTEAWFKTWLSPPMPQHSLRGNLPMDQASLASHLFYQLPEGQRLPAKVEEDPDYRQSPRDKDNRIWRVSPSAELPAGLPVELRVEPGIMSNKGPAPGVEKRVIDIVFALPEFRFLGLRCPGKAKKSFEISPEPAPSPQERCLPAGGVSLLFSSPVVPEDIKAGLHFTPPLAEACRRRGPVGENLLLFPAGEAVQPGQALSHRSAGGNPPAAPEVQLQVQADVKYHQTRGPEGFLHPGTTAQDVFLSNHKYQIFWTVRSTS